MKLEDQVCSLELSKKLRFLKINKPSLFTYEWYSDIAYVINLSEACHHDANNYYPTFTVAELGEMLPAYRNISGEDCILRLEKYYRPGTKRIEYAAEYWKLNSYHYDLGYGIYNIKESDVRAEMLIYLIQNELVKVEDIV